jgi:hypothetical protein
VLERHIQDLLAYHPYLLDMEIQENGYTERSVASGRIDIFFDMPSGVIVVECKKTHLKDDDVLQLRRYLTDLKNEGKKIYKAYLVGYAPMRELKPEILEPATSIIIKKLIEDIPLNFKICRSKPKGHYFDSGYERCPYCGEKSAIGEFLSLIL